MYLTVFCFFLQTKSFTEVNMETQTNMANQFNNPVTSQNNFSFETTGNYGNQTNYGNQFGNQYWKKDWYGSENVVIYVNICYYCTYVCVFLLSWIFDGLNIFVGFYTVFFSHMNGQIFLEQLRMAWVHKLCGQEIIGQNSSSFHKSLEGSPMIILLNNCFLGYHTILWNFGLSWCGYEIFISTMFQN
jgi:hypothetical protein